MGHGRRNWSLRATALQNPLATPSRRVFGLANNQVINVARKSKTEADKKTDVPAPDRATDNAKAPKRPAGKTRPTAAKSPRKKPATTKEKTPKPAASPRSEEKPTAAPAATEPSDDAVRIRAYFLGERRARLSLPGDSAHDWIEARRQLLEEAGQ
jgi:hypothetical protein